MYNNIIPYLYIYKWNLYKGRYLYKGLFIAISMSCFVLGQCR